VVTYRFQMCEQVQCAQFRKYKVTASDPHTNTEADAQSAVNIKLMTRIPTQRDTSFVDFCEGHPPTAHKCQLINPRLRLEEHTSLTFHSPRFSLSPIETPSHLIGTNIPERPTNVTCVFQDSGPTERAPAVQTQRRLPISEGCTRSLHPLGTLPGAILSPRSYHKFHSVFNLYCRYNRYHTN
jgi:hypothetical protein